jgi:hypothetical protein
MTAASASAAGCPAELPMIRTQHCTVLLAIEERLAMSRDTPVVPQQHGAMD